jgi:hypothetical protein
MYTSEPGDRPALLAILEEFFVMLQQMHKNEKSDVKHRFSNTIFLFYSDPYNKQPHVICSWK